MLRAQIGQSVLFKTPTKLQDPYCNSFGAIAIGKLHPALRIRNVSEFLTIPEIRDKSKKHPQNTSIPLSGLIWIFSNTQP